MNQTDGSANGMTDTAVRLHAIRAEFDARLTQNLQLCAALEDLADRLPVGVTSEHCRMLLQSVPPALRQFHEFEEKTVFPLLRQLSPDLSDTLDRLSEEHFDDCSFAEEIEDRLSTLIAERDRDKVDSLGYMLRGLFAAMRRHIAFEREYLLPHLDPYN